MKRMRIFLLAVVLPLCLSACDTSFTLITSETVVSTESQESQVSEPDAASSEVIEAPEGPDEAVDPYWHSIITEIPNPDRTLTLNGTIYPLKFSRERALQIKSDKQRSYMSPRSRMSIQTKRYSSRRRCEWVAYEKSTDRLVAFELHTADYNSETCIPEAQAIAIAENFLKGQCDLSQFERKSAIYLDEFGLFEVRYERKLFGCIAEQAFVAVTKRGNIAEYEGAFDYNGALSGITAIDEAQINQLLKSCGALTYGGNAILGYGTEWCIEEKNAYLEVFFRDSASDSDPDYGYTTIQIKISGNENGEYSFTRDGKRVPLKEVPLDEVPESMLPLIEREPDEREEPDENTSDQENTSSGASNTDSSEVSSGASQTESVSASDIALDKNALQ